VFMGENGFGYGAGSDVRCEDDDGRNARGTSCSAPCRLA
jgi:hypothetical protein